MTTVTVDNFVEKVLYLRTYPHLNVSTVKKNSIVLDIESIRVLIKQQGKKTAIKR